MNIDIQDLLSTIQEALSSTRLITQEILDEYENYSLPNNSSFNIFQLISDKTYRENFHSDILAKLLENEIVLKNFLDFTEVDSKLYLDSQSFNITREQGRIDILISTEVSQNEDLKERHCIIIENKLNWAGDMPQQLNRYYSDCINNGYIVDKVIYLSPFSGKQPAGNTISDIPKDKLKIMISYDGSGEDFYKQVLLKSISSLKEGSEPEWLVLAEHYAPLLEMTGSNCIALPLYETICKSPNEYEKVQILLDFYSKLTLTRVHRLISAFEGRNHNNIVCFLEFKLQDPPKSPTTYVIDIRCENQNYTSLELFTRENIEATEQIIPNWLKEEDLFHNFKLDPINDRKEYPDHLRWRREFKFPLEESLLYDFIQKVIDLFNRKCSPCS